MMGEVVLPGIGVIAILAVVADLFVDTSLMLDEIARVDEFLVTFWTRHFC